MAGGDRKNADPALIAALAGGATVQDAARQAGVSERTAHRRLDDAAFQQEVFAARAALITGAVCKLAAASTEAADTLRALLAADTPPAVRLGACRAILELGTKRRESEEHEARIRALEEHLAAAEPRREG